MDGVGLEPPHLHHRRDRRRRTPARAAGPDRRRRRLDHRGELMPTDKTPRDADETLALPVTDAGAHDGDRRRRHDRVADDDDRDRRRRHRRDRRRRRPPCSRSRTAAPPSTTPPRSRRRDREARARRDASAPGRRRGPPVPEHRRPGRRRTSPRAYTSPIGALYAPTDRPDPAPAARVAPDPVADARARSSSRHRPTRRAAGCASAPSSGAWSSPRSASACSPGRPASRIDLQLAMIVLLAVAGTALLVGSIVSGARAARR